MIPWSEVRPKLVELIQSIAHDEDLIPLWEHRAQPFESPTLQQSVYLRIATVAQESPDAQDFVEGDDGELYEQLSGHRYITLSIKCDAFVERDDAWSFQTAERIRTRLGRQTVRDALLELDLTLVETLPAVDVSYTKEGHVRNVAVFDAILLCTFTDVSADPTDHWTKIEVTSDIRHADDTSVGTPPNFENQQIPEE